MSRPVCVCMHTCFVGKCFKLKVSVRVFLKKMKLQMKHLKIFNIDAPSEFLSVFLHVFPTLLHFLCFKHFLNHHAFETII